MYAGQTHLKICIAALLLLAWLPARAQNDSKPPNVVLIISDDQAWTDYGFMGHPHIQTPRLDRLAGESLLFPNGYVPSSLCSPSLMSIVTGLYPAQHKITGNDPPLPARQENAGGPSGRQSPEYRAQVREMIRYVDSAKTLPRLLKEKGYASFQSGKWWMGRHSRGGFTDGMTHGDPDRGGRHGDEGLKIGREGMKPIFDFIQKNKDRPFFVWYAPFLPHTPHTPPDRLFQKYRDKTDSEFVAKYWAMIEWFDETCGQLLDFLDRQDLEENTVIIYVTDNGWIQHPDQRGYAPKSKRSPYDGGLKTPVMVRWPGKIAPQRIPYPVSSLDIAPTVLKACGLEPDKAMPGVDLRDLQAVRGRDRLFGDVYLHNAVDIHRPALNLTYRWCLEDQWKLIVPHRDNVVQHAVETGTGEWELYHLLTDPYEETNLAKSHPEIAARLKKQIDAWWETMPVGD